MFGHLGFRKTKFKHFGKIEILGVVDFDGQNFPFDENFIRRLGCISFKIDTSRIAAFRILQIRARNHLQIAV